MANTYTQLYFHIIFVVKRRENLISKKWKIELYKYISGTITNKNQKLMCINGVEDHVHILIGLKPDVKLSDVVRDIKANSSRFINEKKWVKGKFEWQIGFAAFTVGHSQIKQVINYINNQEQHHMVKSFRAEYLDLLIESEIEYDTQYLFTEL